MPPVSRTEPRRIDSGTPRDTVYPWRKGINKQKTNKQIKSVCLVKSAVCDVAFGDRRELLHECAITIYKIIRIWIFDLFLFIKNVEKPV